MEALLAAPTTPVTFYFISFTESSSGRITTAVSALRSLPAPPIFIAKPVQWIAATPLLAPALQATSWDLLIASTDHSFLSSMESSIAEIWSIATTVPVPLIQGYSNASESLASAPPPGDDIFAPGSSQPASGGGDRELTVTPELQTWASSQTPEQHISMFNLLAFEPNESSTYFNGYIPGFQHAFTSKGVGTPKILGFVDSNQGYENVALVHYPSAKSFVDMLGSKEYERLDREFKKGVVMENGLLAVTEDF